MSLEACTITVFYTAVVGFCLYHKAEVKEELNSITSNQHRHCNIN